MLQLIEDWAGWIAALAAGMAGIAYISSKVVRPVLRWGARLTRQLEALTALAELELSGGPHRASLRETAESALESAQRTERRLSDHLEDYGEQLRIGAEKEREFRALLAGLQAGVNLGARQ